MKKLLIILACVSLFNCAKTPPVSIQDNLGCVTDSECEAKQDWTCLYDSEFMGGCAEYDND